MVSDQGPAEPGRNSGILRLEGPVKHGGGITTVLSSTNGREARVRKTVDAPNEVDDQPVLLSPPQVGVAEREAILRALDSGWIAPAGGELDNFEQGYCANYSAIRQICDHYGVPVLQDAAAIAQAMNSHKIEVRHSWKPMHMQPVFADCESIGSDHSERVFASGLCFPSAQSLTNETVERVAELLRAHITLAAN